MEPSKRESSRASRSGGRTGLWDSLAQRLAEVEKAAEKAPPSKEAPAEVPSAWVESPSRGEVEESDTKVDEERAAGEDQSPRAPSESNLQPEETPSEVEASSSDNPFPALQEPVPSRLGRLRQRVSTRFDASWSQIWPKVFRWLGTWWRFETSVLEPRGGRQILLISARPGDEIVACAATLLAHTRNRDQVTVLQMTTGTDRPAFGLPEPRSTECFRHESEEAARLLGFDGIWSGLEASDTHLETASKTLGELLETLRPAVIYSPSRLEPDPAVQFATRALARTLEQRRDEVSPLVIRIYGNSVPVTPTLTNLVSMIPRAELSHLAFTTYLSRRTQLERQLRRRQLAAGLWQMPHPTEELWQLDAHAFHRLHRQKPSRPPAKTFRPIDRPWSDPFAYLRGRRERQRFARQALLGPMLFR